MSTEHISNPWQMNPFYPPKGPPAGLPAVPHQHTKKPLPDQNELFEVQKGLQRLSNEISEARRLGADVDAIENQFASVWKKFNAYLREWSTR